MSSENVEPPAPKTNPGQLPMRKVSDPRTLRALAHPVRMALFEVLGVYGPLTATQAGDQIGESSTTCSFHLRQLAKYGYVEEAGGGRGRERPWQLVRGVLQLAAEGDPESEIAAEAVARLMRDRQSGRYQDWLQTKASYPPQWRDAATESLSLFYLTPPELKELSRDIREIIINRYPERDTDPAKRPPGSVPVELMITAYPLSLPEPGGGSRDSSSGTGS